MVRQRSTWWGVVLVGILGASSLSAGQEAGSPTAITAPVESEAAIRRAVRLLPRRPKEVRVVDADGISPESRERFLKSEAFVTNGSPVVYLTRHSPVLQAAGEGSPAHVQALAAIIWHEMAHIDGADEREAQRREESLWKRFIRDDKVDRVMALRYLKAMNDRHP